MLYAAILVTGMGKIGPNISGLPEFNSKPMILALSLNNATSSMSLKQEGVTINFEHHNNSLV